MRDEEAPGAEAEGNSDNNFEGINLDSQDTGQQRHQDSDDRIYARGAPLYWEAGWRAPLPFLPRTKSPPLTGWTGYDGRWPDEEQIATWAREQSPLSPDPPICCRCGVEFDCVP